MIIFLLTDLVVHYDRLVDNLLELGVLQVRAHHHLEDLKQLTIADVAVVVNVVNSENKWNIIRLDVRIHYP